MISIHGVHTRKHLHRRAHSKAAIQEIRASPEAPNPKVFMKNVNEFRRYAGFSNKHPEKPDVQMLHAPSAKNHARATIALLRLIKAIGGDERPSALSINFSISKGYEPLPDDFDHRMITSRSCSVSLNSLLIRNN